MYSIQFIHLPKDKIILFLLPQKLMIHQREIDNLIAQTNYLSSMFQDYHDALLKQSRAASEESKSADSERESIFESSESQNNILTQNFLSNQNDFNISSPDLNQLSYHDDLLDHEIHDRPTGYMRDQEENEINEKIFSMEKSIELCFKAIESQLQIRTMLKKKGMLVSSAKEKSTNMPYNLKRGQKTTNSSNKNRNHI